VLCLTTNKKIFLYIASVQLETFSTITDIISYLLTPWCSRVLLEKLTGLQLVKKFPAFHGTRRFITALTSVRHLSLSWPAQSSPYTHILEIHPNIIHPSNWFAASQGIPRISRNPKVHYRTHKRPPPVSILASSIQSIYPPPGDPS